LSTSNRCFLVVAIVASLFVSRESAAQTNGDVVDQLNGVSVYFNSPITHSSGRNVAADGYYLGLRYQCVEFVKRYYYERFGHRMPKPTGNGVDYFDLETTDGAINPQRGLLQYRNGSQTAPHVEDILVFGARPGNPYGHVAIVSAVSDTALEIIQQNPGPSGKSRMSLRLSRDGNGVKVENPRVLGWLRLPGRASSAPRAPVQITPTVPELQSVPSPQPENSPVPSDSPSEKAP